MGRLVSLDGKITFDLTTNFLHNYGAGALFFDEWPEEGVPNTVTGDVVEPTVPRPPIYPSNPSGLFVTPNEQYYYVKGQYSNVMQIYDNSGTLIKNADSIPNYTGNLPSFQQESPLL